MRAREIRRVLNKVEYKDWKLFHRYDQSYMVLWWAWYGPNATDPNGPDVRWTTDPVFYPQRRIRDAEHLLRIVFRMALQAEEHECREFFQYDGKRPFNPHTPLIETEKTRI